MAKSKRRRLRQKQALEAESSITDSGGTSLGFVKEKRPSLTKQMPKRLENRSISHEKSPRSLHAGNTCYDAVICHSSKDGKIALDIKMWLEDNIPQQTGNSTRPSKIELMGTINANYVTSLELASKRTKTIIVVCTKHFCNDAVFKKAVHALWTWEADRDLQVFPLLVGFEEQEPPPECISVRDAHVLHFRDCPYFRYVMAQRLSHSSVEHSQSADEDAKGKRGREKEAGGRQWQEHGGGDNRARPLSRNVPGQNRRLRSDRGDGGGDERAGPYSGADDYDSGVPSTGDWCRSSTLGSSLSGPRGFPVMPLVERAEENATAPDTSPGDLPEAAVLYQETSERDPPWENHASARDANGTVIKAASSPRKAAGTHGGSGGSGASGPQQAQLTDDSQVQTDGPQSCDGAHISHTAPTHESGPVHRITKSLPNSMVSKRHTAWKPLRRCSLPDYVSNVPEKEGYLTPVACSMDCQSCESGSEAGGSSYCGEQGTFEYRLTLTETEEQESKNVDPLAPRKETARVRLNQVSLEINAGRQNVSLDAATMSPPNHRYINTDYGSRSSLKETLTPRPSSGRQSQPPPMTAAAAAADLESRGDAAAADTDTDGIYEAAEPVPPSSATRFQAQTVNLSIFKTQSVSVYGTAECKISNEDLRSPAAKCNSGMSTYQTWPCKACGTPPVATGLSEDAADIERKHSNRPQLPPPRPPPPPSDDDKLYYISTEDMYGGWETASVGSRGKRRAASVGSSGKRTAAKTPLASVLRKGLRFLLPCYRKKKRRQRYKSELEAGVEFVDVEDPYDSIPYLGPPVPVSGK